MKKILSFLVLIIIGIIIYFSFFSYNAKSINKVDNDIDANNLLLNIIEEEEENFTLLNIEDIEKELASEKNEEILAIEIKPNVAEDAKEIMVETDINSVKKSFQPKKKIFPIVAIELPKNSISKLNIGDIVSLPYMGTGQFNAEITSKTTHNNGSVSISGNLVDEDKEFSVVLTEGKNMSFGTITTPNGSFEIETKKWSRIYLCYR